MPSPIHFPKYPATADCWYLTGATATGKTQVGIALARHLGAEIVSLDSMAIYRGMDIGTAKPSKEDQRIVTHHLIDIRDPSEEFSVAEYVLAANRAVREIRARNREVLFVGGTPLYLKSLLRGLDEGPKADWEFRQAVEKEIRNVGSDALFDRVRQIDPVAAAQLHPNDIRRLIRALEVHKLTGQPISHLQLQFEESRSADVCRVFVLRRDRKMLHARISHRVDHMLETGLIDEVRSLTTNGRILGRTARQAVGYAEVLAFLAGQTDLAETAQKIKIRTRRFAKRQETWFRSLRECRFVDMDIEDDPNSVANHILQLADDRPSDR
ncbi:MAG: tRNA (adenosine(37)-N6)-dimethylallyltransferase MiaA [Pirellulales bacterium]|nr:tRNA (adenosine(37)-N6)-dimethylallyltransferase MiaA [Pirellulales bacterium]